MKMVTRGGNVRQYRIYCSVASIVTLTIAFITKYYSGPYATFSDAYLGDVFIVMCLYFVLSFIKFRWPLLLKFIAIALFASGVEFLQKTGLPKSLNLPEPFVFILGTSFDPQDFIFYGIGLGLAVLFDFQFQMKAA